MADVVAAAVALALIGGAALVLRRVRGGNGREPAVGSTPTIPAAKPQGSIPTLKDNRDTLRNTAVFFSAASTLTAAPDAVIDPPRKNCDRYGSFRS